MRSGASARVSGRAAARRLRLVQCARCGQWRTRSQIDQVLNVCEPCAERVVARDLGEPTRRGGASLPPGARRRERPRDVAVEEVEWLLGYATAAEIARRLGCPTVEALQVRLRRADRADLVTALAAAGRRPWQAAS